MSFGYSVTDIISLTKLAWDVIQNTRKACGEHASITRDLLGFHTVLQRLELEVSNPQSLLNRKDDYAREELARIANHCDNALRIMSRILAKYKALSEEGRSVIQFRQKVRFGNGAMQDMRDLRLKILTCMSAITLFLNLLAIGSQGRVEQFMGSQDQDIKNMRHSLNWVVATLQAKSNNEGSILTSRLGDDKAFWKGLRRELIDEGFSSEVLRKHKTEIKQYVLNLGDSGALDDISDAADLLPTQIQPSSVCIPSSTDKDGKNVDCSKSIPEDGRDGPGGDNRSDVEDVEDIMDADLDEEEETDEYDARDASPDLKYDNSWDHQLFKGLHDNHKCFSAARDEESIKFVGCEESIGGQGISRPIRNVLPIIGESSGGTANEQSLQNDGVRSQDDGPYRIATGDSPIQPPMVSLSMSLPNFSHQKSVRKILVSEPDKLNPEQSFKISKPLKGILMNASLDVTESRWEEPSVAKTSESELLSSRVCLLNVDEVDFPHNYYRERLIYRMSKPIEYNDLMSILSKRIVGEDQRIIECVRLSAAAAAKFENKNAGVILLKGGMHIPRKLSYHGTISGYQTHYSGFIPRTYKHWDPCGERFDRGRGISDGSSASILEL
ncbi:hypothetical protein EG329_001736 [Mollisiaceae sp. DMI_Dod_QoI]|nr:hypothetical protein EG329_001736 [Helotiales sp. DMI_Dod_QoI]